MTTTRRSIPIFLPSFGASIEKGTIIRWNVSAGDTVCAGQVLAEIETDKATVELEATDDGVVEAIEIPEGGPPVAVGTKIASLAKTGSDFDQKARNVGTGPQPEDTRLEAADSARTTTQGVRRQPDAPNLTLDADGDGTGSSGGEKPQRIPASPRARRLARESGLSVREISGSGPDGSIVGHDLATTPGKPAQPDVAPDDPQTPRSGQPAVSPTLSDLGFAPGSYDLTPLTGMRKTIARRLTESFRDVPHYSLSVDVELDGVAHHRQKINESLDEGATTISINDFVIWAAAAALKDVPEANASYTEDGIALHHHADIAVAVAIRGGLVTPVVRAAETRSIHEIAAEMRLLAERARARKLEKGEFEGGTFTVSNLGMVGIKSFTSVLNPPQGCILSVGAAEARPAVRRGEIAIATKATMTLTCDHRVVDGVVGAEFLASFKTHLTTPPKTANE